jgi:Raf kinase inhibitor-like YbhB/YbcL family protein
MPLTLSSPDFAPGARMPDRCTYAGAGQSPELHWSGAPEGTVGFALIMEDPDAPAGVWIHWVLWGLPAAARSLPAALPPLKKLAGGLHQGLAGGVDRFSVRGYQGPCPPSGTHHYLFQLYALDHALRLPDDTDAFQLRAALQGHSLAEAHLIGTCSR